MKYLVQLREKTHVLEYCIHSTTLNRYFCRNFDWRHVNGNTYTMAVDSTDLTRKFFQWGNTFTGCISIFFYVLQRICNILLLNVNDLCKNIGPPVSSIQKKISLYLLAPWNNIVDKVSSFLATNFKSKFNIQILDFQKQSKSSLEMLGLVARSNTKTCVNYGLAVEFSLWLLLPCLLILCQNNAVNFIQTFILNLT